MSIVAPGEYSGFQVMGMIEWGKSQNPQKIPSGFQQNPRNSLDQKFAPPKKLTR